MTNLFVPMTELTLKKADKGKCSWSTKKQGPTTKANNESQGVNKGKSNEDKGTYESQNEMNLIRPCLYLPNPY